MKKMILPLFIFPLSTFSSTSDVYLSDWWHQSVNVVGSYHNRFSPFMINDLYLEYEAYTKTELFDFYGYADVPKFFGTGNSYDKGIWDKGSPLFIEIEPRISIDKLTGLHMEAGPFKEWYFANNYVFDMGQDSDSRQNTWYMGLGTDVDTGLPLNLSLNIYAKYQWQNYGADNENTWDGYRFKIKYFIPLTRTLGGNLNYTGFTNFDFGSKIGNKYVTGSNGNQLRSDNAIASSHILTLSYPHWHYSVVARYFHNGGQWKEGAALGEKLHPTGWGYYLVAGYNF